MPGRRHVMDSTGSTYEDCVQLILGRIASMVRVPREKDFGIDFYVQPRIAAGPRTETVAELASVQVKGGEAELSYGGVDSKGTWREYELAWLRSLATPLYLAQADSGCTAVEMFSLWPVWLIFWQQRPLPFEVIFTTQPAVAEPEVWRAPEATSHRDGAGIGDGKTWTVHLGPPFLRLTNEALNDSSFVHRATAILRTWIACDRLTLMRYHQFVPVLTGFTGWRTDPPEVLEQRMWQFWDSRPGANIARLCHTASPMLVNLGAHLQWQNDWAAYKLVPVLEWLDEQGYLDPMGQGLLNGLRGTQARGLGPAAVVPSSEASDDTRVRDGSA